MPLPAPVSTLERVYAQHYFLGARLGRVQGGLPL